MTVLPKNMSCRALRTHSATTPVLLVGQMPWRTSDIQYDAPVHLLASYRKICIRYGVRLTILRAKPSHE